MPRESCSGVGCRWPDSHSVHTRIWRRSFPCEFSDMSMYIWWKAAGNKGLVWMVMDRSCAVRSVAGSVPCEARIHWSNCVSNVAYLVAHVDARHQCQIHGRSRSV